MKHVFSLVLIIVMVFAVASCGSKKKTDNAKERVSKEISAEEGGTISTSDESVSIEVPAEALDSNTKITMTVYETSHYSVSEGEQVMSTVVECEPSGTIFKKPILIKMTNKENIKNQVITAAVFNEEKGAWSYSQTGAAVQITGRDEAGDPIMMSAGGDPIMLNAAGDPIMMSAGGDPIMLSAAGDPIMVTAAGDPIMNSAAGDPIMMTTGHFTAYTFIALKGDSDEQDDPGEDDVDDDDAGPDEDEDKDAEPVSVAECGNGIVEEGEECDSGADNGRFFCDYGEKSCELCSLSCKLEAGIASYCGDGSIDPLEGETCDDGADNDTYGHCNAWCDGPAPYCGDGTKQDNEECDLGENNGKTDCSSGVTECVLCTADCHFKCKENYTLSGSKCVANTQTKNCTGLPSSNAQWNTASSITQTWSGSAWLPATTAVYNETASASECRFKCKNSFFWNGSACVSPCESNPCNEASANAVHDSCTPESLTEFTCGCNDGYAWSGDKCLPECAQGSDFPCIDSQTGLVWSSLADETMAWDAAGTRCESELTEGGYTDWRLPTIDELRTLIVNCPGSQAGGACVISDPDHLSFSERIDADCCCSPGSNFSILGDGSDINLWSSSTSIETDGTDKAWLVGFYRGNVNHSLISESNHVRCVRPAE